MTDPTGTVPGALLTFSISFGDEALISTDVTVQSEREFTLDDLLELMKSGIQHDLGRVNPTLRDLFLIWRPS